MGGIVASVKQVADLIRETAAAGNAQSAGMQEVKQWLDIRKHGKPARCAANYLNPAGSD